MLEANRSDARSGTGLTVQRDDLSQGGGGFKIGAGEQLELKVALNDSKKRIKFSGKISASRKGSKVVESPTAPLGSGEAKWSLVENKASMEAASGKFAAKLASSLFRLDISHTLIPGFPGLKARFSTKALEAKFNLAKLEVEFDLIKVTGAIDGDATELLDLAGLGHLRDRVVCKASFEVEVALNPADLARLKAAWRASKEVKAAADAALKHGDEYAKHAEDVKKLEKERAQLNREVQSKQKSLDRARRQLENRKEEKLRSKRAAAKHRQRLVTAENNYNKAKQALADVDTKLARNKQLGRESFQAAKRSRKALEQAAQTLHKAGRKLDAALTKVSSKLGQIGKAALEKATKKIMKKLGVTLAAKLGAYLIPGLNILAALWDGYEILKALTSDAEYGTGGGDGDGSDAPAGGGGDAGAPDAGDGGDATRTGTDADPDTGPHGDRTDASPGSGSTGGGKVELSLTARALADAFAGPSVPVDDATAELINKGIPQNITPAEFQQLIARLKASATGGLGDPFELVGLVNAELDDIRAGGTKVSVNDQPLTDVTEQADPPKALLPGTRADVIQILSYDKATGEMQVEPERLKALLTHEFTHPDGLKVKLSSIDVGTRRPDPGRDLLMVTATINIEVVALPAGTAADYPYTVGQTATEKMTFIYETRRGLWGEMDYTVEQQLQSVVARHGSDWALVGKGHEIAFEYATVKVMDLVRVSSVKGPDGSVKNFVSVRVLPLKITGEHAGYLGPDGWVDFEARKPTAITFIVTEKPVAAGKP